MLQHMDVPNHQRQASESRSENGDWVELNVSPAHEGEASKAAGAEPETVSTVQLEDSIRVLVPNSSDGDGELVWRYKREDSTFSTSSGSGLRAPSSVSSACTESWNDGIVDVSCVSDISDGDEARSGSRLSHIPLGKNTWECRLSTSKEIEAERASPSSYNREMESGKVEIGDTNERLMQRALVAESEVRHLRKEKEELKRKFKEEKLELKKEELSLRWNNSENVKEVKELQMKLNEVSSSLARADANIIFLKSELETANQKQKEERMKTKKLTEDVSFLERQLDIFKLEKSRLTEENSTLSKNLEKVQNVVCRIAESGSGADLARSQFEARHKELSEHTKSLIQQCEETATKLKVVTDDYSEGNKKLRQICSSLQEVAKRLMQMKKPKAAAEKSRRGGNEEQPEEGRSDRNWPSQKIADTARSRMMTSVQDWDDGIMLCSENQEMLECLEEEVALTHAAIQELETGIEETIEKMKLEWQMEFEKKQAECATLCRVLEKANDDLKKENELMKHKLMEMQSEIGDISKERCELRKENSELGSIVEALQHTTLTDEERAELEESRLHLYEERQRFERTRTEQSLRIMDLELNIAKMQRVNKDFKDELGVAQSRLLDCINENADLSVKLEDAKKKIDTPQLAAETLRRDYIKRETRLVEVNKWLVSEREKLVTGLPEAGLSRNQADKSSQTRSESGAGEPKHHDEAIDGLKEECDRLVVENRRLLNEVEDLTERLAYSKRVSATANAAAFRFDELVSQNESLLSEREVLKKEVEGLNSILNERNRALAFETGIRNATQTELTNLLEVKALLESEVAKLRQQLEEKQKESETLAEKSAVLLKKEVEVLNSTLNEKNRALAFETEIRNASQAELTKLRELKALLESEVAKLREQFEEKQKESETLSEKNAVLLANFEEFNKANSMLKDAIVKVKSKADAEAGRMKSELHQCQAKCQQLETEVKSEKEKVQAIAIRLHQTSIQLDSSATQLKKANEQTEAAKAESMKKDGMLRKLQSEAQEKDVLLNRRTAELEEMKEKFESGRYLWSEFKNQVERVAGILDCETSKLTESSDSGLIVKRALSCMKRCYRDLKALRDELDDFDVGFHANPSPVGNTYIQSSTQNPSTLSREELVSLVADLKKRNQLAYEDYVELNKQNKELRRKSDSCGKPDASFVRGSERTTRFRSTSRSPSSRLSATLMDEDDSDETQEFHDALPTLEPTTGRGSSGAASRGKEKLRCPFCANVFESHQVSELQEHLRLHDKYRGNQNSWGM